MKKEENGEVEAAINQWFIPKRSSGQPISWLVLCEKALMFNHQLGVASIPNESPPQNKNLCWTFFSSTGMNLNTINQRSVFFDSY
jgi:hypothetical protein